MSGDYEINGIKSATTALFAEGKSRLIYRFMNIHKQPASINHPTLMVTSRKIPHMSLFLPFKGSFSVSATGSDRLWVSVKP